MGKDDKEEIKLSQVPTQVANVFKLPDGKELNADDYLVFLGNLLLEIRKAVVGK